MKTLALVLIIIYVGYLVFEKMKITKSRSKIDYVVHINGIRGKSSVTRLIWAGISDNKKVFCKTTGTIPTMIFPDKTQKEIKRLGKANINEQVKMINIAAKHKSEVAVIECMALKPEYQRISTNEILNVDIGVITNIRHDHTDVFGESLDEIASALSYSIPVNGKLVITNEQYLDFFIHKGKEFNTQVFLCDTSGNEYDNIDMTQNVKLALYVCKLLGMDEKEALRGIENNYIKDPGIYEVIKVDNHDYNIYVHDLLAVNDTDSLNILYKEIEEKYNTNEFVFLINNRKDRMLRLEQLIAFISKNKNKIYQVWLTGDLKYLAKSLLIKNGVDKDKIDFYKQNKIDNISKDMHVLAIGNIKGFEGFSND